MLDTLTGGRVVAGMLRGTSNEYVTYATNPAESRERFEEALELIVRAWTEPQPFGWQGRYYEYRTISIWPRPVQQPHPPIYMSGSSPESGEFAARNRLQPGLRVHHRAAGAARRSRYYREQARRVGWEPDARRRALSAVGPRRRHRRAGARGPASPPAARRAPRRLSAPATARSTTPSPSAGLLRPRRREPARPPAGRTT